MKTKTNAAAIASAIKVVGWRPEVVRLTPHPDGCQVCLVSDLYGDIQITRLIPKLDGLTTAVVVNYRDLVSDPLGWASLPDLSSFYPTTLDKYWRECAWSNTAALMAALRGTLYACKRETVRLGAVVRLSVAVGADNKGTVELFATDGHQLACATVPVYGVAPISTVAVEHRYMAVALRELAKGGDVVGIYLHMEGSRVRIGGTGMATRSVPPLDPSSVLLGDYYPLVTVARDTFLASLPDAKEYRVTDTGSIVVATKYLRNALVACDKGMVDLAWCRDNRVLRIGPDKYIAAMM